MEELYAVYLESLDQDLRVFEKETEAQAHFDAMQSEGKPVKMEKFSIYQVTGVDKANGEAAADPGFWEELRYDNGNCKLIQHYSWHQAPEKEGYYADYSLEW
ncbi:MAG: hypothetical protein SPJ45_06985 [Anaerovoracaceae bacterium]|nr:hypothetical protein [Bacillota bacterium]MDD7733533.1 hypothetical protein [Bacillota bacterium]MDY5906596.1 hypothetical protein [Anaerovoracaceae bacterium]